MNRILFSPLGMTDPISICHDGAMLHICRVYKPDKVYLYMSREIWNEHEKDNRFCYCLDMLGEKLNHKFEVEIIERKELVDVHKFDDFYDDFAQCLEEISKDSDAEILLNVSSGTPAMKSTLQIYATLHSDKFKAIQVATPVKSSNERHEDRKNYSAEIQWKCNEDNEADFQNRCSKSNTTNLLLKIQKQNIRSLINEYDYSAASYLAEGMQSHLSEKAVRYIKAAECRLMLDIPGMQRLLGEEFREFVPEPESDHAMLVEYLLNLDVKLRKRQFADFIRAITPAIFSILIEYVENLYHLPLSSFCVQKNGIWYMNRRKMRRTDPRLLEGLDQEYGNFKENPASSEYLSKIIELKQSPDTENVLELRNVEKKIRNYAAHEIMTVTEEKIERDTGVKPEEILKIMESLAIRAGIRVEREYWNSYDEMNRKLLEEISI